MNKTFEDVLEKSNSLARASHKRLIAITYYPESGKWIAGFADVKGSSYVEFDDKSSAALQEELETHYSYDHWYDSLIPKINSLLKRK